MERYEQDAAYAIVDRVGHKVRRFIRDFDRALRLADRLRREGERVVVAREA